MTLDLAVVIPAYNGARFLGRVLTALYQSEPDVRVVVVDAGSTDDTADVASKHGAKVIRLSQREGPAKARNVGVTETEADVMLFIDADCVPHPGLVARVHEAFLREPNLVSITGSYDTSPPETNFFSEYMNLRHHFFHQRALREDATFWAGCGAIRRDAFIAVGGFDSERYPTPQIEDIELGLRLRRVGLTRLDPTLQVSHLKRWDLRSVVQTDIRCRALPWGRLILESGELPDDLNLGWSQRIAAGIAPVALAALLVLPWSAWAGHWTLAALAATALAASAALHAEMFRCFTELRGIGFALRGCVFQQVHLVYSSATMAYCALEHIVRRLGDRLTR